MNGKSSLRMLQAVLHPSRQQICTQLSVIHRRCFRPSVEQQTDGVYKALTEMRVRTPWIEALRHSRDAETQESEVPPEPVKPDLTPKRMSDSHFKCVRLYECPLFLTYHDLDTPSRSRSLDARYVLQFVRPDPLRGTTHGP